MIRLNVDANLTVEIDDDAWLQFYDRFDEDSTDEEKAEAAMDEISNQLEGLSIDGFYDGTAWIASTDFPSRIPD